jgi:hypothetical protein
MKTAINDSNAPGFTRSSLTRPSTSVDWCAPDDVRVAYELHDAYEQKPVDAAKPINVF